MQYPCKHTGHSSLTAAMSCAVMQAEERVFIFLLDSIFMGFKGSRVVLPECESIMTLHRKVLII